MLGWTDARGKTLGSGWPVQYGAMRAFSSMNWQRLTQQAEGSGWAGPPGQKLGSGWPFSMELFRAFSSMNGKACPASRGGSWAGPTPGAQNSGSGWPVQYGAIPCLLVDE